MPARFLQTYTPAGSLQLIIRSTYLVRIVVYTVLVGGCRLIYLTPVYYHSTCASRNNFLALVENQRPPEPQSDGPATRSLVYHKPHNSRKRSAYRMILVDVVLQLLDVVHLVSLGAAYVLVACHVLHLPQVVHLQPMSNNATAHLQEVDKLRRLLS